MVREKYAVQLMPEEREELQQLIRGGKNSARVTTRARILLKTDEGWTAPRVAEALDVSVGTVFRIKRRLAEDGLEGVLWDRPQANRYRKLDDRGLRTGSDPCCSVGWVHPRACGVWPNPAMPTLSITTTVCRKRRLMLRV